MERKEKVTRLDYCQYLSVSRTNYTLTNFAEHCEKFSHDMINRYLSGDKITPNPVWENVNGQIMQTSGGCIISDDTVTDKNYSYKIGLVRRQYSGNAHGIINGDGKTRSDHVKDMPESCIYRQLNFSTVLTDTWYAAKDLMLYIENLKKFYYCPIKSNRPVDDSDKALPYRHADSPEWNKEEAESGRIVKTKDFPKNHKVRLFRVVLSSRKI